MSGQETCTDQACSMGDSSFLIKENLHVISIIQSAEGVVHAEVYLILKINFYCLDTQEIILYSSSLRKNN